MSESAERQIEHGAQFPYDATDEWWKSSPTQPPPPATDWAHAAARGVLADLLDRRSIKWALARHEIDEDIRQEIVNTIADIIRTAEQVIEDEFLSDLSKWIGKTE